MWIFLPRRHLLLLLALVVLVVVVVVLVVVMVVVVIVQVAVIVVVKLWSKLVNNKLEARAKKCRFGPVNTYLGPGLLNTNWGPGPVNTNRGPGLVNTNWGPGPEAKQRAGGQAKSRGPVNTNTLFPQSYLKMTLYYTVITCKNFDHHWFWSSSFLPQLELFKVLVIRKGLF